MVKLKRFLPIIFYTCILTLSSFANASDSVADTFISSKKQLPEDITELRLKNGMRVWLKPTNYEMDHIEINLTALGGYSSLEQSDRISGNVAGKVSRESGIADMSCDQFSEFLYSDSIEYDFEILLNSRSITASSQKNHVDDLLRIINNQFTKPCYSEKIFKDVIFKTKRRVANKYYQPTIFNKTSSIIHPEVYKLLTLNELVRADFKVSKDFFERALSRPSEYITIIVGDFNVDDMAKKVETHLATIPNKTESQETMQIFMPDFPKGVHTKIIKNVDTYNKQIMTRIVFPINVEPNPLNETDWHFATKAILQKLKKSINHFTNIEVSRTAPFYPSQKHPWFIVQFTSSKQELKPLIKKILSLMNQMMTKGISNKEILSVRKTYREQELYWMDENLFWINVLKEYAINDWDPAYINKQYKQVPDITNEKFIETISKGLSLDTMTVITVVP